MSAVVITGMGKQMQQRPPNFECVPYETRYRNPDTPKTIFNVRETIFDLDGKVKEVSPWWVETIEWSKDDHLAAVSHNDLVRVLAARVVERIQKKDATHGRS
jgi:hypothetical protein